ncbi:unnamed protein product [Ambrosiozyma monospora]|uniref:Unnamed protein product n=1 Tax=Ambrosiozyma monospora TaxID=43982 RepID=A0ACB5SUD4_AMBMO|nr:unnamed protein product [Ambrosiozyma monospora]
MCGKIRAWMPRACLRDFHENRSTLDYNIEPSIQKFALRCQFELNPVLWFDISFDSMASLKFASFDSCILSTETFDSLPDTLSYLSLKEVVLEEHSLPFKLPKHLNKLSMQGNFKQMQYIENSNITQLEELDYVSIYKVIGRVPVTKLKSFIHALPRSMKGLVLKNCVPSKDLELNKLECLEELSFSDTGPSNNLDLSTLPSCYHLRIENGYESFSLSVPSTVESMRVNSSKGSDVMKFWKEIVTPMPNLHNLDIVKNAIIDSLTDPTSKPKLTRPLALLTSLIGYHSTLDGILVY